MGPPAAIQSCPVLPETISLRDADGEIAVVDRVPRTPVPAPLEMLPAISALDPGPFYLDYIGTDPCLYPVTSTDFDPDPLAPDKILSKQFIGKDKLFGIPTLLQPEKGKILNGALYDGRSNSFYAPDRAGLKWYLIGDISNYATFIDASAQQAQGLYFLWKAKPSLFLRLLLEEPNTPASPSRHFPAEAERKIQLFMTWLQKHDPQLHGAMEGRLGYRAAPLANSCMQKLESVYAFVENDSGKVNLLPPTIDLLQKRKYAEVAQILSHEWSHLRSFQAGLVSPSEELMGRSINSFFNVAAEDSWFEALLVWAFGDTVGARLECAMLPYIPEEEAHAFAEEFAYSTSRLPSLGFSGPHLQHEALDGFYESWNHTKQLFPGAWSQLSMQYFLNAQDVSALPTRSGSRVPVIRKLFEDELIQQIACPSNAACDLDSSEYRSLLKEIPIFL
jgi:hypothetical protein